MSEEAAGSSAAGGGTSPTAAKSPEQSGDALLMNIVVKTSKEREAFQIAPQADVKDLRQLVSERYQIEPSKACLIFSGKILKDGDLLSAHSKLSLELQYLSHHSNHFLSLLSAPNRHEGRTHCAFSYSRCKCALKNPF